ncbi:MAG: hypothetical protein HOV80_18515 [Polyangiaceae bacterium]|nr:hypothetical protein [Polyangiaceae bacterium]
MDPTAAADRYEVSYVLSSHAIAALLEQDIAARFPYALVQPRRNMLRDPLRKVAQGPVGDRNDCHVSVNLVGSRGWH